jgi:energy-coupling factor transport system substrate-specific component
MTWQLASFLLVAIAVAAGFTWYERSHPPAKIVSMVGALAALATVGRIAFAPFPNVKPTTDIVLFAGYALGPAPGFAVGAISALASNVFFGQGPWTPWQMAAWGMVGVGGGLLGRATKRGLGRWPLAAACGVAGAAFGLTMDTYQWTLAPIQGFDAFVAISASSLPYNAAHVVGNVAFCLALGPAFVRALTRYRRRFEVRWALPAAASLALAVVLASPASLAEASSASRARAYLEASQNADGGFGGARGQASNQLHTGWVSLGLAASGRNPRDVIRGGKTPIDYMRSHAGGLASDLGETERTILVLRAAGVSPRSFGGRDLMAALLKRQRSNGSFRSNIAWTTFGVLAMRAGGLAPGSARVKRSVRWLLGHQNRDGGFGVAPRAASDTDNTGSALQALAGARVGGAPVRRAVAFLKKMQRGDGGFGQLRYSDSNAQSTAWAVQGLVAAGRNPDSLRRGGHTPLGYLRSLQQRDGSVRYSKRSRQTPVWVTADALAALARRPLRLASAAPRARPASTTERRAAVASAAKTRAKRRKRARARAAARPDAAPPAAPDTPQAVVAPAAKRTEARKRHGLGGDERVALVLIAVAALGGGTWLGVRRRHLGGPPAPA